MKQLVPYFKITVYINKGESALSGFPKHSLTRMSAIIQPMSICSRSSDLSFVLSFHLPAEAVAAIQGKEKSSAITAAQPCMSFTYFQSNNALLQIQSY